MEFDYDGWKIINQKKIDFNSIETMFLKNQIEYINKSKGAYIAIDLKKSLKFVFVNEEAELARIQYEELGHSEFVLWLHERMDEEGIEDEGDFYVSSLSDREKKSYQKQHKLITSFM